jgi:hypothetical protein
MASLFYSLCALRVLRAYADACEAGRPMCDITQPYHYIESE